MKQIEEITSFAAYLGDETDRQRTRELFSEATEPDTIYPDCSKLVFSDKLLRGGPPGTENLKVIPPLAAYWKAQNLSLTVYLFLREGKIAGGQIHKRKKIGRDSYYETDPTVQEIKLVRRILDYITRRDNNENTNRQLKK